MLKMWEIVAVIGVIEIPIGILAYIYAKKEDEHGANEWTRGKIGFLVLLAMWAPVVSLAALNELRIRNMPEVLLNPHITATEHRLRAMMKADKEVEKMFESSKREILVPSDLLDESGNDIEHYLELHPEWQEVGMGTSNDSDIVVFLLERIEK